MSFIFSSVGKLKNLFLLEMSFREKIHSVSFLFKLHLVSDRMSSTVSATTSAASVQKRAGVPSQLANLQTQLKESTQACVENFTELVKLSDVNNQKSFLSSLAVVQQEHLEIQVGIEASTEKMFLVSTFQVNVENAITFLHVVIE